MKTYTVHATLHSEARSGDIWTYEDYTSRLVKVKNMANNKSIIVSYRYIDENFEKTYNRDKRISLTNDSIVLDGYYRNKLGFTKDQRMASLTIKKAGCFANITYLVNHPNDSVRISTWLAIFSLLFGFLIGVIFFIVGLILQF